MEVLSPSNYIYLSPQGSNHSQYPNTASFMFGNETKSSSNSSTPSNGYSLPSSPNSMVPSYHLNHSGSQNHPQQSPNHSSYNMNHYNYNVPTSPITTSGSRQQQLQSSGSLSPPQVPSSPTWRKCCINANCLLCNLGTPRCLCMNHPSWTLILRVVFFSLANIYPDKEFFNLKKEVYLYLNDHWTILSPTQKQSNNWKRQVQDALSHSRFFKSGRHTLRCNGYWQLKLPCNPWNYANSKQFEALRFEELSNQQSPYQTSGCDSVPLSPSSSSSSSTHHSMSSPTHHHSSSSCEIPWRIESKPSSSAFLKFNGQNNNNNIVESKLMDIKQLLSEPKNNINNNNNNNSDVNYTSYDHPSSPLSDPVQYHNRNHHRQSYSSTLSTPSSFTTSSTNNRIKISNSISSLSLLSETATSAISSPKSSSKYNSHNNSSISSFESSPSFNSYQQPLPSLTYPHENNENNDNNNNDNTRDLSIGGFNSINYRLDEEMVSSKITQMKSILNCTV